MTRYSLALVMATILLAPAGQAAPGHATACFASAVPDLNCPISVDVTYLNVTAGSFNRCLRSVRIASTDPSVILPPINSAVTVPEIPALIESGFGDLTGSTAGDVQAILGRVVSLRRDLDEKASAAIRSVGDGLPGFFHHSGGVSIDGALTASLQGQPGSGGVVTSSLGISSLHGWLTGRAQGVSVYLFGLKVTVRGNDILFGADYNVGSGSIESVRISASNISYEVKSDLFPPPFVASAFIDPFKERLEDGIELSVNSNSAALFGMDENIPTGVFVRDGVDYGQKVRDQLADFVEDIDVSITQGGKRLSDVYVNVRVGNISLTAGSKVIRDDPPPLFPSATVQLCGRRS